MLARDKWRHQQAAGVQPDPHAYEEILGEMVRADQTLGDLKEELADSQDLLQVAHAKAALQHSIDELKTKLAPAPR